MTLAQQLNNLIRQLQPKIDSVLGHEVAEAIKSEEIKSIEATVYDAYRPTMYDRRGDFGGLADPENIICEVHNGELHVRNDTPPNPGGTRNNERVTTGKHLAELIEHGHARRGGVYDFPKYGATYMGPRPFTQSTFDRLRQSKKHISALRTGLKKLGITIR